MGRYFIYIFDGFAKELRANEIILALKIR